jgi:hypothetical protein
MEQVPFQTCQLCIEAWKTEVSLRGQQPIPVQSPPTPTPQNPQPINVQTEGMKRPVFYNEGLMEIDELLKNEMIDPFEYVKLRKMQLDKMTKLKNKGKLILSLDLEQPVRETRPVPIEVKLVPIQVEPVPIEIKPVLKEVKVAVIVKTLFGKQVYTSPDKWKLPKAINNKVIKSIFKLASRKKAEEIRLRAGKSKIACVRHAKGKIAIMVIDADEDFEEYNMEMERVSDILTGANFWATAVKKIN